MNLQTTTEKIYQIKAPHFCAGFAVEHIPGAGYFVIDAAPIIHYLIGWDLNAVANYCKRKKWDLIICPKSDKTI